MIPVCSLIQADMGMHFIFCACIFDLYWKHINIDFFQGIPEQTEIPPVARAPAAPAVTAPASAQAINPAAQDASQLAVPSSGPNANPLDLFPQVVNIPEI